MKRGVLIVLWTAIFLVMVVAAWRFAWYLLMRSGIGAALHQDLVDQLDWFAYVTYGAVPLLGLLLGLFGKLPGTELAETETPK